MKLGLASAPYELMQSISCVIEYLGGNDKSTWDVISAHEETLQSVLLAYLASNKRVTIYGESSADKALRVPVISFTVAGSKSKAIVDEVEKRSPYAFRNGHMYSYRLVKDVMGLKDVVDGVVRVSLLHYNTGEHTVPLFKDHIIDTFPPSS